VSSALSRLAKRVHGRRTLPAFLVLAFALLGPVVLASASTAPRNDAATFSPTAVGTNDDDNPRLSIDDASVAEGSSGTTAMTFTVTRSGSAHGTSSVHYETAGVTAASGVDFAPASGMLSFPTGASSRTLTVDVNGDGVDELDELLVVNLSNPTGGHIVDGQGEGTITDDDSSPVAASQSPSTDEDTALPLTLAATDADGDALTYSVVTTPEHGTLAGANASRTYTPAADFNGTDFFTFEATDGVNDSNVATVTITVDAVNDPPLATANSAILAEDSFALASLPATDVDGDPLSYSIADEPAHGSLSGSGASRTYTPDQNYNGADFFTFVANDGTADSNVATVSVTVIPVNDAPVAAGDAITVAEDSAIVVDLLANDFDVDEDTLTITSVDPPAHGTAIPQADGTVLYMPQANYNGGDSFTYSIADGNGGTDSASVAIAVTPVNDAPVAADSSAQVAQNTPEEIPLDPTALDVSIGGVAVAVGGVIPPDYFEPESALAERATAAMRETEIAVRVRLGDGPGASRAYGCDLSYEYVRINGEYTT